MVKLFSLSLSEMWKESPTGLSQSAHIFTRYHAPFSHCLATVHELAVGREFGTTKIGFLSISKNVCLVIALHRKIIKCKLICVDSNHVNRFNRFDGYLLKERQKQKVFPPMLDIIFDWVSRFYFSISFPLFFLDIVFGFALPCPFHQAMCYSFLDFLPVNTVIETLDLTSSRPQHSTPIPLRWVFIWSYACCLIILGDCWIRFVCCKWQFICVCVCVGAWWQTCFF
jgi:hypothetical protein